MFHGIIPAIGKHIIAEDTLACRGVGIGINESAQFGIVITGLEVVERGLSVLRLTTIPNYTLDTHTKPQGFRVGIIDAVVMYSTILIYGL